MSDYYHRDGTPAANYTGSWEPTDPDCKRVAETKNKRVQVSTVFLALDHSWGDGPPLIFETMVFGGAYDNDQERYATEAGALAGHARWVRLAISRNPLMWARRKGLARRRAVSAAVSSTRRA